jgi:hypothetical protein
LISSFLRKNMLVLLMFIRINLTWGSCLSFCISFSTLAISVSAFFMLSAVSLRLVLTSFNNENVLNINLWYNNFRLILLVVPSLLFWNDDDDNEQLYILI